MLELLAMQPLAELPPLHLAIVKSLGKKGLVTRQQDTWCLTPDGLLLIGRDTHRV